MVPILIPMNVSEKLRVRSEKVNRQKRWDEIVQYINDWSSQRREPGGESFYFSFSLKTPKGTSQANVSLF